MTGGMSDQANNARPRSISAGGPVHGQQRLAAPPPPLPLPKVVNGDGILLFSFPVDPLKDSGTIIRMVMDALAWEKQNARMFVKP